MRELQLTAEQKKWTKEKMAKLMQKYDRLLPEQDVWVNLVQEIGELHKESKYNPEVKDCLLEIVRYYEAMQIVQDIFDKLGEK